MAYGHNSEIGISFQNSYGTSLTNSVYWIRHVSDSVGLNIEQITSEGMRGIFDMGDNYEGKNTIDGDLEVEIQPISIGAIFSAVFAGTSTVTSDSIYTHTFEPRTSDFDTKSASRPITYHQYLDTGSAQLFYDLNASALEISIAQGELTKASVSFVGGSFSQISNLTASYPTGSHFVWDVASLSLGGSANAEIMDMTISLDEALEAMWTLDGTKTPSRIKRNGHRAIEVSGTFKFDTQTEFQNFISQTEEEMILTFTGPTEIQSGYYDVIKIQLPLLRYTDFKPSASGAGELEVGFSAVGKYSVSSATSMIVTLTNTQAAY